jgi:hypothetical protein
MQRKRFPERLLLPVFLCLAVMLASRFAYFNAGRLDSQALYRAFAVLAGTVHFASIVLAAAVVYPVAYFRGASGPERVAAGSANLAVWLAIDTYNMTEAFPWEACLYYGMNIGLVLFAWNFAHMGMLELACRWGAKKRGETASVLTPLPLLPLFLFLFVVCFLSREGGAAYFNSLLDGYVILFRH